MDAGRFDSLIRSLGGSATRRSLVGLLAGLTAGTAAIDASARRGNSSGKHKRRRKPGAEGPCGDGSRTDNICSNDNDCCTGICKTGLKNKDGQGRCRCIKKGKACTEDKNCCGGRTCAGGVCGGGGGPSCGTVCPTGCTYSTIQAAIDAAAAGDVILIGEGTYTEELTIAKNLTLEACTTATVIDTGANLRTITITGGSVVELKNLIVDGTGTATVVGGGINNSGQLTLSGTTMVTNGSFAADTQGGCMYSHETGNSVTMKDSSSISTCFGATGGGVLTTGGGAITMTDTAVIHFCTTQYGGAGIRTNGPVTMSGSAEVSDCTATSGSGAGILIIDNQLSMSGSSTIKNNTAGSFGGGVFLLADTAPASAVLTETATITGNTSTGGGGVYASSSTCTLTAPAGSISGNTTNQCAGGNISC